MLQQRYDFKFEKRIDTMDGLPRIEVIEAKKLLKQRIDFPREKKLIQRIDCLQEKAIKLLKQRLDFPFKKRIEIKRQIECLQCKAKKVLKQRLDYPFDKRIQTINILLTMQGQKIVETTVRFPIREKN